MIRRAHGIAALVSCLSLATGVHADVIYVDQNVWEYTDATLSKILVITGFITSAISFATAIIGLVNSF